MGVEHRMRFYTDVYSIYYIIYLFIYRQIIILAQYFILPSRQCIINRSSDICW